jgi:purine-binding chemotaxis protein CheW
VAKLGESVVVADPGKGELQDKLVELRQLFDVSFAAPIQESVTASEQMLAITMQGEGFALRVREIGGLAANKGTILPVPSRAPQLLGLTGIRGTVVPVFSLAALLGFPHDATQPHWLVFCGGKQAPIALAFDELEYQFEVPAAKICARQNDPAHGYVTETLQEGSRVRGVISVGRLVEFIRAGKCG